MTTGQQAECQQDYNWEQWLINLAFTWQHRRLWEQHDRTVIAVSGGLDSMMLLYILTEWNARINGCANKFVIAHVHHGFRVTESDEEALFVERVATKLNIPFEMKRVDALGLVSKGVNRQAAARQLRYQFFVDVAHRYQATHIALGHHADDQAETALMRFIRGAGITGLSGMDWKRKEKGLFFIRPLLAIRKSELLKWCKERNVAYIEDSSNEKRDYFRNRLRLDMIPLLEQENPRLVEALCRMTDTLREEDNWLHEQAEQIFQTDVRSIKETGHGNFNTPIELGYTMDRNFFIELHVALQRRLFKLILEYVTYGLKQKIQFETVEFVRERIISKCSTTWRIDIAQHVVFIREYEQLIWLRKQHHCTAETLTSFKINKMDEQGTLLLPDPNRKLQWFITTVTAAPESLSGQRQDRGVASFDADALCWPLVVRTRQPGDRMKIEGLHGSKKIQDMFVDLKISPSIRNSIPLIVDANGCVIWVAGIRRSAEALVNPLTKTVVYFMLKKKMESDLCKQGT